MDPDQTNSIAGVRIRIWVGLKIMVPAKSSLEREILPGRILSPRKDWKDSGRNLQIPPVASGNDRRITCGWNLTYVALGSDTFFT